MDKEKMLKVGGIAAIVVGSATLYLTGTPESAVSSIVGAVFILAGLIAAVFRK